MTRRRCQRTRSASVADLRSWRRISRRLVRLSWFCGGRLIICSLGPNPHPNPLTFRRERGLAPLPKGGLVPFPKGEGTGSPFPRGKGTRSPSPREGATARRLSPQAIERRMFGRFPLPARQCKPYRTLARRRATHV